MSHENVEIVRRAFEEFARGGYEALVDSFWTPEIVWDVSRAGVPGFGVYRGYDEVRSLFEDWFEAFPFKDWEQELNELIDCGDRVVAVARQRAQSASGASVEVEYTLLYTLRGGKIVRTDVYQDRESALTAAGLRE